MALYSASQSTSCIPDQTGAGARRRVLTGAEWTAYFRVNAACYYAPPPSPAAEATPEELAAIVPSLRGWQLGETSDGSHLRAAAAGYAIKIGDPDYLEAVELFIAEEQRHGESLGRYLDRVGAGRARRDWGDSLFRLARYFLTNMETWTTPVVMVETLALVYYNAIRHATGSDELFAVCTGMLRDEVAHLRFACERLATIYRRRGPVALQLTMAVQQMMFLMVATLVWCGHRRALRAGGYGFRRYWRSAWGRMNESWRLMNPTGYRWHRPSPAASGDVPTLARTSHRSPSRAAKGGQRRG